MTLGNRNTHGQSGNAIRFDIDPRNPLHMESFEKQSKRRSRGVTNVSPSRSARSMKTENSASYHSSSFRDPIGDDSVLFLPSDSPTSSQRSIQQVRSQQGAVVSDMARPQGEAPSDSRNINFRGRLSKRNEPIAVAESITINPEVAGRQAKQGDEAPLKFGAPKGTKGETRNSSVRKEGTGKKEGRPRLKSGTTQREESHSRCGSITKDSNVVSAKEAEDMVIPRKKTQEAQGPKKKRKDVSDVQEGPRKRQHKGF